MAAKGITADDKARIVREVAKRYREQLKALTGPKPGLSKKQAEDMAAGCEDGARAAIAYLLAEKFITEA
jgi:hypothetical protein